MNKNLNGLRNIHPGAIIGNNVVIEPFATIGNNVVIGDNTWIGPNTCIMDGARIGKNCNIFPGAVVGAIPQDLKFEGEESILEIGDHVTIREYCTLNRGTKANHQTRIGDHTLLMAYVHVAHDCMVGRHCILANNVGLAGHIEVGDWAILGGYAAVHQFVKIGRHAMVGGGSLVRKDIPPFIKAARRDPISYVGVNSVGLKRRGFSNEQINLIQDIYRILFVKGNNTKQALEQIEALPVSPERDEILDFVKGSSRGLLKGLRSSVRKTDL
ncbi:MAG: acyl-ACP--UDP-N-acetylglucosamine O-acyltransferase [Saprospirales bacterium]|jgi:UDP-N-acetylglucosamine acyltransferase|nr:acyl-ACP--UDP-N-acetylglucosamine O-acyltransferase [Saprospirales bacterium]